MKRFIQGAVVGVVVGLFLPVIYYYGWHHYNSSGDISKLLEIGKIVVEQSLANAKVTNVVIGGPSNVIRADGSYDKKFETRVRYERNGKMKELTFEAIKHKGKWILPSQEDIYVLDDKANIIHEFK